MDGVVAAPDAPPADGLRVLLYRGPGVAGLGPDCVNRIVEQHGGRVDVVCDLASVTEWAVYDVLVVPGGCSRTQAATLGLDNMQRIREFVRLGGGYVGFCAGAFLGGSSYLHLVEVDHVRNLHKNGDLKGRVDVQPEQGQPVTMNFHNGPVWHFKLPKGVVACGVVTGVSEELSHVRNKMRAKPCIIQTSYGRGRVVLCGPHPEHTQGLEEWTWELLLSARRV